VLDSIRKYKRLVRTIIVAGTLLVAAISLLIPATYLATAQLAVDVRQSGAANAVGPSGAASAAAEESIIDTHVTVLLSDAYLRRLLPTFSERENAKNSAGTGAATWLQELRTLVGGAWSATRALIRKPEPEDVAALSALKRNLRAGQERRSRIVSVTFADLTRSAPRIPPTRSHNRMSMRSRAKSRPALKLPWTRLRRNHPGFNTILQRRKVN
jgi:uncharacterized protein involved in exopolysaccharide biosynthesis